MYQLDEKIWFWVLGVIPVIFLFFFMLQIWKHKSQNKFADKHLLKRLSPNKSLFKSILKIVILSLAFACLAFALVNPKIGNSYPFDGLCGAAVVFKLAQALIVRGEEKKLFSTAETA